MILLSKGGNELLVAGCQSIMFKIDIDKGNIIQSVSFTLFAEARACQQITDRLRRRIYPSEEGRPIYLCCDCERSPELPRFKEFGSSEARSFSFRNDQ